MRLPDNLDATPPIALQPRRLAARPASVLEAAALQGVMDGAPRHFLAVEGRRAGRDAARRLLEDAEADPLRRVFALAPRGGGPAVGLLDLHLHHPVPGTAHVGLLLLVERAQGLGFGREVVDALERALPAAGFDTLALAVADETPDALGFWEHLGFAAAGRLEGGVTVLERRLRSA